MLSPLDLPSELLLLITNLLLENNLDGYCKLMRANKAAYDLLVGDLYLHHGKLAARNRFCGEWTDFAYDSALTWAVLLEGRERTVERVAEFIPEIARLEHVGLALWHEKYGLADALLRKPFQKVLAELIAINWRAIAMKGTDFPGYHPVYSAARVGSIGWIQRLLPHELHVKVLFRDACCKGQTEVVRYLVDRIEAENGPLTTKRLTTAITDAVSGDIQEPDAILRMLVRRYSGRGCTTNHLCKLIEKGRADLCALLLEAGVNTEPEEQDIVVDGTHAFPLYFAILHLDVAAIELLLRYNASLHFVDQRPGEHMGEDTQPKQMSAIDALAGERPGGLSYEIQHEGSYPLPLFLDGVSVHDRSLRPELKHLLPRAIQLAQLLLDQSVRAQEPFSQAAVRGLLFRVLRSNHVELAAAILSHPEWTRHRLGGFSVISRANSPEMVQLLEREGMFASTTLMDLRSLVQQGNTFFEATVSHAMKLEAAGKRILPFFCKHSKDEGYGLSSTQAAQALLSRGADPNTADRDGTKPLHAAAEGHQLKLVKELLRAGADVHAYDGAGLTPLHRALNIPGGRSGKVIDDVAQTIHELLGAGADPNAVSADGTPVFHVPLDKSWDTDVWRRSCYEHMAERAKFSWGIVHYDECDDNADEEDMCWVVPSLQEIVLQKLANHGANVNAKNADGETALDLWFKNAASRSRRGKDFQTKVLDRLIAIGCTRSVGSEELVLLV